MRGRESEGLARIYLRRKDKETLVDVDLTQLFDVKNLGFLQTKIRAKSVHFGLKLFAQEKTKASTNRATIF